MVHLGASRKGHGAGCVFLGVENLKFDFKVFDLGDKRGEFAVKSIEFVFMRVEHANKPSELADMASEH
jgi:hypothetical protein